MSDRYPRHRLARTRFWSIAVIAIAVAVFGSLLATPPAPIEAERGTPIEHEASSAHDWISKR